MVNRAETLGTASAAVHMGWFAQKLFYPSTALDIPNAAVAVVHIVDSTAAEVGVDVCAEDVAGVVVGNVATMNWTKRKAILRS